MLAFFDQSSCSFPTFGAIPTEPRVRVGGMVSHVIVQNAHHHQFACYFCLTVVGLNAERDLLWIHCATYHKCDRFL